MRPFLTAEWRHLLMLNYSVDPRLLKSHLPRGVELDHWNGTTYVSMVGFLFANTKVLGLRIPRHVNFEEVNLRFYVRRKTPEGWRRGVVFIREIVPRRLIATVAKIFYDEPYIALPMGHHIDLKDGSFHEFSAIEYGWVHRGQWDALCATAIGSPQPLTDGSEEEFITEHYWGYTARRNGATSEYQVEHPRWKVWRALDAELRCDVAALYGEKFVAPLQNPKSAFIAEGSPVTVYKGSTLS